MKTFDRMPASKIQGIRVIDALISADLRERRRIARRAKFLKIARRIIGAFNFIQGSRSQENR